jgi:hypothetical protein
VEVAAAAEVTLIQAPHQEAQVIKAATAALVLEMMAEEAVVVVLAETEQTLVDQMLATAVLA